MKHIDNIEFNLIYLQLLEDEDKIHQLKYSLENWISKDQVKLTQYKNNELFHDIIKYVHKGAIKRGKQYFVVTYKDIDFPETVICMMKLKELEDLQKDEYYQIIEAIEIV